MIPFEELCVALDRVRGAAIAADNQEYVTPSQTPTVDLTPGVDGNEPAAEIGDDVLVADETL
jgi:hypothetical protein